MPESITWIFLDKNDLKALKNGKVLTRASGKIKIQVSE